MSSGELLSLPCVLLIGEEEAPQNNTLFDAVLYDFEARGCVEQNAVPVVAGFERASKP